MTIRYAKKLKKHLDKSFSDFNAKLLTFDKQDLIDLSADITLVKDVYRRMTEEYNFDNYEAIRLLAMDNPLESVTAEWDEYRRAFDEDFRQCLMDILDDEDFEGGKIFIDPYGDDGDFYGEFDFEDEDYGDDNAEDYGAIADEYLRDMDGGLILKAVGELLDVANRLIRLSGLDDENSLGADKEGD